MHADKVNLLFKKFPKLYSHSPAINCGDGWFDLILSLSQVIEHIINSLPPELQDEVFASYIKEKFGTLSYFMNAEIPKITGAIDMAEYMSSNLCEVCGNSGHGRNISNWLATLCETHYLEKKLETEKILSNILLKREQ